MANSAQYADRGNPNVYRTFKGRYILNPVSPFTPDTNVVMLSSSNDVQPIGDWELKNYSANTIFAVLPEECHPLKEVKIPVITEYAEAPIMTILNISADGKMSLASNANGKLWLSGINFNISDRWY